MTTPQPKDTLYVAGVERYGGAWQEMRAYMATILFGWAQSMHFAATMDMARGLVAIEAAARKAKGGKP